MKHYYLLFVLLLMACDPIDVPIKDCIAQMQPLNTQAINPDNGLIENDIIADFNKGLIVNSKEKLFKDNVVPYYFRPEIGNYVYYTEDQKPNVIEALAEFSRLTNVTFKYYESRDALLAEHEYGVQIIPGVFGVKSYYGRQGGIQELYIPFSNLNDAESVIRQKRWTYHGATLTVGVGHEWKRADANNYLNFNIDNVYPKYYPLYEIDDESIYCQGFDVYSITFHDDNTGAIDPEIPIVTLKNGDPIPVNNVLSQGDIETINALYPAL